MICAYLFGTLFWTLFCANKCRTNEGKILNDGQVLNLSSPCVSYSCHKGNLKTEKCPGAGDPMCKASFVEDGPFPKCCGAVLCSESGRRRP
uniref:Putative 8.9 kDa family member n=1 Tax=Rhipicephalus pulchellus TaxID=72859 RepID=L7LTP8_RHIPC